MELRLFFWRICILRLPNNYNRTNMELRPFSVAIFPLSIFITIEPIWNWDVLHNSVSWKFSCRITIEPIWNWDFSNGRGTRRQWYIITIEPIWNWDLLSPSSLPLSCSITIEPIWNWDLFDFSFYRIRMLQNYNRTNMELRRKILATLSSIGTTDYNRTNMELRPAIIGDSVFTFSANYNRTNMELRQTPLLPKLSFLCLITIEPIWNWDRFSLNL